MQEERKISVGELLKQRRQEMNLSLREIENGTSIRTSYLQAIEEGEVSKMISPIYAQGFIRQYAAFLGLDGDAMVRGHPEMFQRGKREAEFSYGIGTLEVRGNPGAGVKWLPNAVWIAAFTLLILTAWAVARYLHVI